MLKMPVSARVDAYKATFTKWPASWPQSDARWMSAVWLLGNDYRNASRLYGAYPPNYLKRVMAFYPDAERVLHLFAGSLPAGPYDRFDLSDPPDGDWTGYYRQDAHSLGVYFPKATYDLVLADPPYSATDAAKYGTKMVNRRLVLQQIHKVLKPGGHLVWLDTQVPMFRKVQWNWWGTVCLVRSVNHRVRVATFFERAPDVTYDAFIDHTPGAGARHPGADASASSPTVPEVRGEDDQPDPSG